MDDSKGILMHKFDPAKIELLMGEERKKDLAPSEFLRSNGLSLGMVIADIGCGPGFFTLPAAEIVGHRGKVYAVDIQEEMLDELKKRNPPQNAEIVHSSENHIPIEDGACDMVFIAFVFHEAADKPMFLKELKRMLKPGGKFLLLDWQKKVEDKGPPYEERIAMSEVERLLKAAGFEMVTTEKIGQSYYRSSAIFSG